MVYWIRHKFVSAKGDGTNTTLVKPSDWNQDHDLWMDEGTIIGRPPGSGPGPGGEIPISSLFTPGFIMPFGGTYEPAGWLLCDGRSLARATYGGLYSVIGVYYGAVDGNSFSLPDLRGRVPAGVDAGGYRLTTATMITPYQPGGTGGHERHTLSEYEMPQHKHDDYGHGHGVSDPTHSHGPYDGGNFWTSAGPWWVTNFGGGQWNMYHTGSTTAAATGISIGAGYANMTWVGGSGPHLNVQPTLTVNFLIKY